jgi:hypothetical protein
MGFCGIMKTEVLPRLDMTLQNPIASRFHLLSLRERVSESVCVHWSSGSLSVSYELAFGWSNKFWTTLGISYFVEVAFVVQM